MDGWMMSLFRFIFPSLISHLNTHHFLFKDMLQSHTTASFPDFNPILPALGFANISQISKTSKEK